MVLSANAYVLDVAVTPPGARWCVYIAYSIEMDFAADDAHTQVVGKVSAFRQEMSLLQSLAHPRISQQKGKVLAKTKKEPVRSILPLWLINLPFPVVSHIGFAPGIEFGRVSWIRSTALPKSSPSFVPHRARPAMLPRC